MEKQAFIVVSYDIPNNKRRTRIHKTLKSYGEWMQYSIFECRLTKVQFATMRARLDKLIDAKIDSVRFYSLCESCIPKIERIGGIQPRDESIFMV